MRTTLTLDRDVAAKLRDEMARTGASMKDVVNAFLRRGLESLGEADLAAPFAVKARPMGIREDFDIDDISFSTPTRHRCFEKLLSKYEIGLLIAA